MTSNIGNLPPFEKLKDDSNYPIWKFQMELYLTHDDLWKYTQNTPENDEIEKREDQLTRAKIGLMVEKECLIYLKQTRNAREAWAALEKAFEGIGTNKKGRLLAKLASLKLKQFGNMRQYVSAIMSTAQELKDIGKEVDDDLLATILLRGLSQEYAAIRITIENSNHALTTEDIKKMLLNFEAQNIHVDDDYYVLNKPINRQRKVRTDKQAKCRICRGYHAMRDCPELSSTVSWNDRVEGNRMRGSRSNKAFRSVFQPSDGAGKSPSEWIMDSGDYAYMATRRDYPWFLVVAQLSVCCLVKMFKLW